MYTYNRTDDARINMEIIRNIWQKDKYFEDIKIIHSFNGEEEWWTEKYLEDDLLRLENTGHFSGAEILLNEGIEYINNKYPEIEHLVILASDTWIIKPEYIKGIINSMIKDEKYLATCPWGTEEKDNMWKIGMAIDFNILNIKWAVQNKLFPIRFLDFREKYNEIFYYQDENIFLERVFALRFKQAVLNFKKLISENLLKKASESYVYRMTEREPVHDERKFFRIKKGRKKYWPKIGLLTHHEPEPKKIILKKNKIDVGEYSHKLITSKNLEYYNQGIRKNIYVK